MYIYTLYSIHTYYGCLSFIEQDMRRKRQDPPHSGTALDGEQVEFLELLDHIILKNSGSLMNLHVYDRSVRSNPTLYSS